MNDIRVPVLYCDIDGTIRWGKDELGRFVNTKDDVRVFDEVPELLLAYKAEGWRIAGISNQGGIGLGHMEDLTCKLAMIETNRQCHNAIDVIVYCPHKPTEGCDCRKPKTGLIDQAQAQMTEKFYEHYPKELGMFVGDRPEDEQCAKNADLPFLPADKWRTGEHLQIYRDIRG